MDTDPGFEAHIDTIGEDGRVHGWAAHWGAQKPCHIKLVADGILVAEAVADSFRHDLLEGGLGHGHYAFSALRNRGVAAGTYALTVVDAKSGAVAWPGKQPALAIPDARPIAGASVATLLAASTHWTDQQLLDHIDCLQLEDNMNAMGVDRFVDLTYHYVLGRWADGVGSTLYAGRLDAGEISTKVFFRDLLLSGERLAASDPLASPYQSRFPYRVAYRRKIADPARTSGDVIIA